MSVKEDSARLDKVLHAGLRRPNRMRRRWVQKILIGLFVGIEASCDQVPNQPVSASSPIAAAESTSGYDVYGLILQPRQNPNVPILAFAFPGRPADRILVGKPFLAVVPVGPDGRFGFSGLEAPTLTIAFLRDDTRDASIDAKDSVAILIDHDAELTDLSSARQILLRDMIVEFDHQRASATRIEVERQSAAGTPTLP